MRGFNIALLLAALGVKSVLAGQDCTGILAASPKCKSEEANHRRDFFYIGGSYIPNTDPNLKGTIRSDQIYVEKLTPKRVNKDYNPLVFFHGGGTTGVVRPTLSPRTSAALHLWLADRHTFPTDMVTNPG